MTRHLRAALTALIVVAGLLVAQQPAMAATPTNPLTAAQRQDLLGVAQRTWNYFETIGVDQTTRLPRGEVQESGPTATGNYTSGTMIGLYLDSIIAARDLGIITSAVALNRASALLTSLKGLRTWNGFLLRWYSTDDGSPLDTASHSVPLADEGFVSSVDDAWYAQALVAARQAFPTLSADLGALLEARDWSRLYVPAENRMAIGLDLNTMEFTGTYDQLYAGPRIVAYVAIGSGTVPGKLWWGYNRIPARADSTLLNRRFKSYTDPQDGLPYQIEVGNWAYTGTQYVKTFQGSMYQAHAPANVVPEKAWAPVGGLGTNDANTALAHRKCGLNELGYPVWGMAPGQDPDAASGYVMFGCRSLATHVKQEQYGVAPYATFLGMPYLPSQSYANTVQLRQRFPALYTANGFLDMVNPSTGAVARRYMAVSQGSIMTGIANTMTGFGIAGYWGSDPFGARIRPYVALENFDITPAVTGP